MIDLEEKCVQFFFGHALHGRCSCMLVIHWSEIGRCPAGGGRGWIVRLRRPMVHHRSGKRPSRIVIRKRIPVERLLARMIVYFALWRWRWRRLVVLLLHFFFVPEPLCVGRALVRVLVLLMRQGRSCRVSTVGADATVGYRASTVRCCTVEVLMLMLMLGRN